MVFLLALSACGANNETSSPIAEAPTRTPVPTYTPTPLPPSELTIDNTNLVTAQPEDAAPALPVIELPSATSAPEMAEPANIAVESVPLSAAPQTASQMMSDPMLKVAQDAVNARSGPGTGYAATDLVVRGATYPSTGRDEAGDWWQV